MPATYESPQLLIWTIKHSGVRHCRQPFTVSWYYESVRELGRTRRFETRAGSHSGTLIATETFVVIYV